MTNLGTLAPAETMLQLRVPPPNDLLIISMSLPQAETVPLTHHYLDPLMFCRNLNNLQRERFSVSGSHNCKVFGTRVLTMPTMKMIHQNEMEGLRPIRSAMGAATRAPIKVPMES